MNPASRIVQVFDRLVLVGIDLFLKNPQRTQLELMRIEPDLIRVAVVENNLAKLHGF